MDKLAIVNEILKELREPTVTSLDAPKLKEFPFNNINDLVDEAIVNFSNTALFNWVLTETQLNFTPHSREYNLTDYHIDYNRIYKIYYILGTPPVVSFYYPELVNRQEFKRLFPTISVEGKPYRYSIEDDNLFVYPTPDQDYGLIVKHYKQLPLLKTSTDVIPMIPVKFQRAIVYEVSVIIGSILGRNNIQDLNFNYIESIGQATKVNNEFLNAPSKMKSSIRW